MKKSALRWVIIALSFLWAILETVYIILPLIRASSHPSLYHPSSYPLLALLNTLPFALINAYLVVKQIEETHTQGTTVLWWKPTYLIAILAYVFYIVWLLTKIIIPDQGNYLFTLCCAIFFIIINFLAFIFLQQTLQTGGGEKSKPLTSHQGRF